MPAFINNVQEIRERAMRKIEEGAVTEGYSLDVDRAVAVLNDALATEIVCVLRYMHHYFMATGVHGRAVADEFKEHADEEREHADKIAERIQQLGGKPDFNPASLLQRSVAQYVEGETLADMIKEDLIAERVVIDVYQQMIEFFGLKDPTTRVMIEAIKAQEEEHASDLSDMLFIVDPRSGRDEGQDPGTNPLEIGGGQQRTQSRSAGQQNENSGQRRQSQLVAQQNEGQRKQPQKTGQEDQNNTGRARTVRAAGADQIFEPEKSREVRHQKQGQGDVQGAKSGRKGQQREEDRVRLEGESEAPPSMIGGVSGRPMSRRETKFEAVPEEGSDRTPGRMTGTNRSPKILEKNRKRRRVA